jgi:hypothetical protein
LTTKASASGRILGGGARLFDRTDGKHAELESVRVVASPVVSHFKYHRRSQAAAYSRKR